MVALDQRIIESLTQNSQETFKLIEEYAKYCEDTLDVQSGYDLALRIQELGFIEEALALTNRLYDVYPDDALVLLRAELCIDKNELDEAIDQLLHIEEDSDYYVSALLVMADAYQQLELYEVALEKLKLAKRLAKDEPVIDLALFELYFYMGENQKAYQSLLLLEHNELIEESIYVKKMARVLGAMGEYEEVVSSLDQLSSEEHDSESLFELGLAYYQLKEYSRAHHQFKELLQKDPDFYSAYYYFGTSAIDCGFVDEGITYLEMALQHNPYHETLYVTLFDVYQKKNDVDKINALGELAQQNNIDGLSWMIKWSRHLLHFEEYDTVIEQIERYFEMDDEESELYWILASAYAALEDDVNAQKWYEQAYLIFEDNVEFLQEYALYLREIGKRDLFETMMSRIKTLDGSQVDEFGEDF
ncbi:tetratricopeptide repeat protein [Carnobacteriaceae bacterium zg-ZUI240]|nr:tetratricopeptide repeat protein [Carnobacteriaceae bacterium zg-ZUI240]